MIISVVIPNYNGLKILKKNLPRVIKVLEKENEESEIIIVDDASVDESIIWLKSFSKESKSRVPITILENPNNLGFSSTVNKGAEDAKGKYILFLNSDVYPKEGFLRKALSHFSDPRVFAVGCLDESVEGDITVKRGRGIGRWERGFFLHRRGEIDSDHTDWVSGGSGIFDKELFNKIGRFDTRYNPFYWEDIDLSYRAKKMGYKLVFEPNSVVVHEHEEGAIRSKYTAMDIKKISYRNQFLFVWKNASLFQLLTHLLWLPYHFVKAVARSDSEFIQGFALALTRELQFYFNPS